MIVFALTHQVEVEIYFGFREYFKGHIFRVWFGGFFLHLGKGSIFLGFSIEIVRIWSCLFFRRTGQDGLLPQS